MLICIDPGHGGKYPGAVSFCGRFIEKENTLAIARNIHGLQPNLRGVRFLYTRMEDKHFSVDLVADLQTRCNIANQAGADLFISIHQNADPRFRRYGAETFYFPGSTKGKKLAEAIQGKLVKNVDLFDRGVKPANFYVLRETAMPAVLVEAGFVGGDPEEAQYVSKKETISRIAEGILMGLTDYLEIEYGPPKPQWHPQKEVDRLLVEGIINTLRQHDQPVTWGEFATILNRIRDGIVKL